MNHDMTRIEHFNITVPSIDAALEFLKAAAPDFKVRKDAIAADGYRWVHIGNECYYFALQEPHLDAEPRQPHPRYKNIGVNHIGLVVMNVDEVEQRLLNAGYEINADKPVEKFHRRVYFYDASGFEWEFVEYFSDELDDRYLYD